MNKLEEKSNVSEMANAITSKTMYSIAFKGFPDLLTADDLSALLKVSKKTTYKILNENAIKHIKTGREYRIPKIFAIDYLMKVS